MTGDDYFRGYNLFLQEISGGEINVQDDSMNRNG